MISILQKLSGGDRRSIGRSNEVARELLKQPGKFSQLIAGLHSPDPVVRMRAADAVEKITRKNPALLKKYKMQITELAGQTEDKEVRWHMAQIFPRLALNPAQKAAALDILFDYLRDSSSIVKTMAMQAIADFAAEDKKLAARVLPMFQEFSEIGTPAMRARGRQLVRKLSSRARST